MAKLQDALSRLTGMFARKQEEISKGIQRSGIQYAPERLKAAALQGVGRIGMDLQEAVRQTANLPRYELPTWKSKGVLPGAYNYLAKPISESLINIPRNLDVGIARTGKEIGESIGNKRQINIQNLAGGIAPLAESLFDVGTAGLTSVGKGVAKQATKQALKQPLKKVILTGAAKGAGVGGMGGLTYGLDVQYGKKFDAKQLVENIAAGAALGGIIGGGVSGVSGLLRMVTRPKAVEKALADKASSYKPGQKVVKPLGIPKAQWEFQQEFNKKYGRNPYEPVYKEDIIQAARIEGEKRIGSTIRQSGSDVIPSRYGAPEGKVLTKAAKAKMTAEERITAPLIGEEKSLIKRVKETAEPGTAAYKAAEQISPTYTPITNKESIAAADKVIKTNVDGAIARVMNQAEPPSAEKSAITVQLMKKFDAEGNDKQLINIINSYDQQLRAAGQYIQASSLWGNLSPTGMVRLAKKTAEKYGQTLDDDFLAQVSSQMRKVNKMADGKAKETATLNVLNSIAEKLPLTKGELFDSYRYTNMLSNPRTLFERNLYQNLFNVFITRPADILSEAVYDIARHPFNPMARDVSLMDVPRYYKYAVNNYSNAIQMASRALKGEIDNIDLGGGQPVLEQIRRQKNTPLPLSVIPRILEAEDKFNSALIAGGEQARLMRKGLSEADATAQAKKIAEEYLYRNKLGSKENEVLVNRALTSLGEVANSIGNKKVIGKPFRWFVPFINTVVNAAKAQVERSPLGFIGGNYNKQQLAKATLGSLVTGMGAMAAMQGRVTWSAPIDEKEKNLFYEQGKKPFSILIGEKWVPAQYLGPFALAFLLPQAVNYYQNETKEALADDQLKKIGKIAGTLASYISQQSSMSGVGGFFRAMEGDTDGAEKTLFFTGEQAIPLSGLLRYIAQAIDPVFRKTKTGLDVIKRDIPFLSKGLEPYTDMSGQPSRRNITDYVAPYSMGINKPEVEPMLLQRRKEIQGKYLLNKMKQEPEKYSGSVTQPTGTASPVVSAYFSDIDTKPEQESWQKIGKSKEYLNKFKSVVDDQSLAPEIKQQLTSYIIQKTGVSQADLNQYYYSSLDVDERTAFVKERILTLPPDQMVKALVQGRKEISGKALLTSSVIDNLVDEGIISENDGKFLKNIKSTTDGKLKTKAGGRVKLKSIKLPKTKLAKLRTRKAPKVRLEKAQSYKFPKLPKALT